MRWTFELHRKSTNAVTERKSLIGEAGKVVSRCNFIRNMYFDLDFKQSFDELLDWISFSSEVKSLFMALEAVRTWGDYNNWYLENSNAVYPSLVEAKFINLKKKRGWKNLEYNFFQKYLVRLMGYLFPFTGFDPQLFCYPPKWISQSESPESSHSGSFEPNHHETPESISHSDTPRSRHADTDFSGRSPVFIYSKEPFPGPFSLLSEHAKLTFHFKLLPEEPCDLPGECGFILKTVPGSAASRKWNPLRKLILCTEEEDYYNENVHFHKEVKAENMHVCIAEVGSKDYNKILPLSWLGWLHSTDSRTSLEGPRHDWERKNGFMEDSSKRGCFAVIYSFD